MNARIRAAKKVVNDGICFRKVYAKTIFTCTIVFDMDVLNVIFCTRTYCIILEEVWTA